MMHLLRRFSFCAAIKVTTVPVNCAAQTFTQNLTFKLKIMLILSLQVHYPVWPTGTHARGLAGGAGPHHQEPAGLWHRDKGRDSPLKPPQPPLPQSSTPWPLTSKPLLGRQSLFVIKAHLGPRTAGHSECALCLSVSEIIYILKDGPEGEREKVRRCFPLSCYRRMHEECLIIDANSLHTRAHTQTLTHMSPSEIKNHALETAPSLQPKDWEIWLMMWKLLWQSKVVFVHMLYTIFHQGWSCPPCHDSGRLPLRLLLPKLEGLKCRATTPSSTS